MFEVACVDSFRMKEDVSLVVLLGEPRGVIGSAVEVVMVIMTFGGAPTGCTRRFSTGGIIFVSRLSSTRIVGNSTDMTGVLLQVTCEAFRLDAGLQGDISDLPEAVYSYVTPTWVTQTWESCQKHRIQVLGDHGDFPQPRQQDVELMRLFIRAGY